MKEEDVPKESQTIAAIRSARVAEKIRKARESLNINKAWWSNTGLEIGILVVIYVINIYLIFPFFGTSSADTFFSGPVIPFLAKIVGVFKIPFSYSIQIINIFFFLTFPLSFYLLIRQLSGRKSIAFLALVISDLPFYPFALVRINVSFLGSDSAHIASLYILPIALLGIFSFLRHGNIGNLITASIFSAMVALTSPFGFMIFVIFAGIAGFSEMLLGNGRIKIMRLLTIFLFTGGLCSFWYNPSFFFWMITGPLGTDIRFMVLRLIPITFFTIPVLFVFGYLLFDRKPNLQSLFLASFFTIAFAMIALVGGGIFPSHPSRYISELGISLSFLLSVLIVQLFNYLRSNKNPKLVLFKNNTTINIGLVSTFLLFTFLIMIGKSNLFARSDVLGIWDEVEKGDIWQAKENFNGAPSVLGYGITLITVSGLTILNKKAKRLSND